MLSTLCLPRPYEDELLYSVFARHHSYFRPHSKIAYRDEIVGGRLSISVLFGLDLETLASRTFAIWSMSGRDILREHTTFDYYSHYFKGDAVAAASDYLRRTKHRSHTFGQGIPMPKYLRYCKSCARADMDRLGETYWRRCNQLVGVLYCVEHEELLVNSPFFLSGDLQNGLHDATSIADQSGIECTDLSGHDREVGLEVARRCRNLAKLEPTIWSSFSPVDLYKLAARSLGYCLGSRINASKLAEDFLKYYGANLLSTFGIKLPYARNQAQFILRGRVDHPLFHVLIQRFFDWKFEVTGTHFPSVKETVARPLPPIRCPNPYANHPDNFRISDVYRRRENGKDYFVARCACGFGFTFDKCDELTPEEPVVRTKTRLGATFERAARRLYGESSSLKLVAREMGLSPQTVRRLVAGEKNKWEMSSEPDRIQRLRDEWEQTRSTRANRALRKFDRKWLLTREKRKRGGAVRGPKLGPDSDKILSTQIAEAAAELRSIIPAKRVSAISVMRHLGRSLRSETLKNMPLSSAALAKAIESQSEWSARKNLTMR